MCSLTTLNYHIWVKTLNVMDKILLNSDLFHFKLLPKNYSIYEYILGQQGEMKITLRVFRENRTDSVFNNFANIIGAITS